MAGLPGSIQSLIPAGPDELVRRMRDVERRLDELGAVNWIKMLLDKANLAVSADLLRAIGTLDVTGSLTVSGSTDITGDTTIGGSLTVTGPATFITPLPTAPYGSDPEAPTGTSTPAGTLGDATVRAQGDSTAVGANAQQYLTTGYSDTAVGANAQRALTTGYNNTAVGYDVQAALTIGYGNTAVGPLAQQALTTGDNDTAVGAWAQYSLTTGSENAAVGGFAQAALTIGGHNTAVGPSAQYQPLGLTANATTTASYQTSVGPQTGQSGATQVDGITTVGYRATAGAANATSIGREARADHAGSIAIGYQTVTTQVDQVMVGPRDLEITDTTKGLVLVSPDNTRYRVTVANGGALAGGGGSPPAATDTVAGVVELATTAEAVTGTDTVRAVTPAGLAAGLVAFGPPTAYTPTLTASTNPTLGTGGAVTGRYVRMGKVVIAWFQVMFGTTGVNQGAGAYYISLPFAPTATPVGGNLPSGETLIKCNALYTKAISRTTSGKVQPLIVNAAVNGGLNATGSAMPGNFTINDWLQGYIIYEADV